MGSYFRAETFFEAIVEHWKVVPRLIKIHFCCRTEMLDSVRIVQKEVGGRNFSLGGGVERRGGGAEIFCRQGVEKEVEGRILSSIIEERGSLHNKSSL